jgi:hypothetical protein
MHGHFLFQSRRSTAVAGSNIPGGLKPDLFDAAHKQMSPAIATVKRFQNQIDF